MKFEPGGFARGTSVPATPRREYIRNPHGISTLRPAVTLKDKFVQGYSKEPAVVR